MQQILPTSELIGRDADVELIAAKAAETRALVVLAEPGCGTSEILRYVCDRLSALHGPTPFYIELDKSGLDRDALASPLAYDSFVVLDGAHYVDGETLRSIAADFERSGTPFIIAGWRRALYPALEYRAVRLARLPFADTVQIVAQTASRFGVELTDACRDLIALLIGGRPRMISSFLMAAADRTSSLESLVAVQQIFTDEIMGGRIGREIDAFLRFIIPEAPKRIKLLSLVAENPTNLKRGDINLGQRPFEYLNALELVNTDRGHVQANLNDHVWSAYVRSRATGPRALVVAKAMAANVTSSDRIMTRYYRTNASFGLLELLSGLKGEGVSRRAIDHRSFRETLKGLDEDAALKQLIDDEDVIELPRVFYAVETEYAYAPIKDLIDKERSAIALGIETSGDQIALVAAEIESKLEVTRQSAEFWCDRLEMAAVSCGFPNYRLWLIAPEGFDDDALRLLADRNAYGTSLAQARLLKRLLEAAVDAAQDDGDVHEFVVPMGEAGELLSAKVLDDLAERYRIPEKPANQIKTALVEALINAAEHSLSPERVVHLRYVIGTYALTVTVSNRGLRLSDKTPATDNAARRGWGLKVIEKLMDEVRVEQTDDGTRLVMTKNFAADPSRT